MLLQIRHAARKLLCFKYIDIVPHQRDRPGQDRKNATQRLEQRALARTVRTDHTDNLPCPHGKRHIVENDLSMIPRIDMFCANHLIQTKFPFLMIISPPRDAHPPPA